MYITFFLIIDFSSLKTEIVRFPIGRCNYFLRFISLSLGAKLEF